MMRGGCFSRIWLESTDPKWLWMASCPLISAMWTLVKMYHVSVASLALLEAQNQKGEIDLKYLRLGIDMWCMVGKLAPPVWCKQQVINWLFSSISAYVKCAELRHEGNIQVSLSVNVRLFVDTRFRGAQTNMNKPNTVRLSLSFSRPPHSFLQRRPTLSTCLCGNTCVHTYFSGCVSMWREVGQRVRLLLSLQHFCSWNVGLRLPQPNVVDLLLTSAVAGLLKEDCTF